LPFPFLHSISLLLSISLMAEVAELLLYHVDELLETFIGESESESESEAEEEEDFGQAMFYPSHVTDPYPETLVSPIFEAEPDMGSDYHGLLSLVQSRDFLSSNDPQPFDLPQPNVGLRITGFDSDSEPETEIESFRWDSFRIEDETRNLEPDPAEPVDFEWEEVAPESHMDQQDLLQMLAGPDAYVEDQDEEVDLDILLSRSDLAWEVLMSEGGLEEEVEDPGQMSEYEVLASQIDNVIRCGNPPAAKGVVETLPTIILSDEKEKEIVTCAICKDEMAVEEKVTKLPCGHFYHKDCIVPWLGIRNSCPVCRFELPTDDLNYENWKDRRRNRAPGSGAGLVELLDRLELDWAV
jgi:Ring finger domain